MADSRFFPLNANFRIGTLNQRGEVVPSLEFIREYEILWKRVGQYTALSNTELEALSRATSLGVFSVRPEPKFAVRQGSGPVSITQGIAGFTVSVDMDQILGAVRAFMPRQEAVKPPATNDASSILANRIFGA